MNPAALLELRNVTKSFPIKRGRIIRRHVGDIHAVDDVSFSVLPGESFGLVGESGCGKSTLARLILRLFPPSSGEIWFQGRNVTALAGNKLRPVRHDLQLVFQDPYGSLNPRKRIGAILEEPMILFGLGSPAERSRQVDELLEVVGLSSQHRQRYPADLSGGQRQRVGIARALAAQPRLVVCDEPVSSLDVSIRAQIINLLKDLQVRFGLTYIFISHDLSVVKHICDRIAVMYLGRIVELGDSGQIFSAPSHPYTQALLSAIPVPDPREERQRQRILLVGEQPDPSNRPTGCHFHPRCRLASPRCEVEYPAPTYVDLLHYAKCHYASPQLQDAERGGSLVRHNQTAGATTEEG